jgi:phage FluMu protein gp41
VAATALGTAALVDATLAAINVVITEGFEMAVAGRSEAHLCFETLSAAAAAFASLPIPFPTQVVIVSSDFALFVMATDDTRPPGT